jgi:hypothetical protein
LKIPAEDLSHAGVPGVWLNYLIPKALMKEVVVVQVQVVIVVSGE